MTYQVLVQTVGGLLTVMSEESGDSQALNITETSVNSRVFTGVVGVSTVASANELTLSCNGAETCLVSGAILQTHLIAVFAKSSDRCF